MRCPRAQLGTQLAYFGGCCGEQIRYCREQRWRIFYQVTPVHTTIRFTISCRLLAVVADPGDRHSGPLSKAACLWALDLVGRQMSFFFRHLRGVSGAFNTNYRALMLYIGNRSLRAWSAAARHYAMRLGGHLTPAFVTVAVTYRCQCRCAHCYSTSRLWRKTSRALMLPAALCYRDSSKGLETCG